MAMLQALYNALDRQRRPLRNHHYTVFPEARIAYARIPGAPAQAMRSVLKRLSDSKAQPDDNVGLESEDRSVWGDDVELLTARELRRRHPDLPVFAIVQSPLARLATCFDDLIAMEAPLPAFFLENNFWKSMPLETFLQRVTELSDLKADNLLRSQASILCYKDVLVPTLVLDLDDLPAVWSRLQSLAKQQSGLDIGPAPGIAPQRSRETLAAIEACPLADRLRKRYRKDYQLFFPQAPKTA